MKTQTLKKLYLATLATGFIGMIIAGAFVNAHTALAGDYFIDEAIYSDFTQDAIEVEDWMASDTYWMTSQEKAELVLEEAQVDETEIKVETWMTDNELWKM